MDHKSRVRRHLMETNSPRLDHRSRSAPFKKGFLVMQINYDEAMIILAKFKDTFHWVRTSPRVNSLVVTEESGNPVLEVGVDDLTQVAILGLPDEFTCPTSVGEMIVRIKMAERIQASPLGNCPERLGRVSDKTQMEVAGVRAGQRARGDGSSGSGTAGWFFYPAGESNLVCMSNWHVFCTQGNDSELGQRCLLNGQDIAALHWFQRIVNYNKWDLAFARVDDDHIDDIEARMQPCSDGSEFSYPSDWTLPSKVTTGAAVHKIGYRSGCTRSTLDGFGDLNVRGIGYFDGQLRFSNNFAAPGDSGSIVILDEDESVMGLVFAGSDDGSATWANPIYQANLELVGWRRTRGGQAMPEFSFPSVWSAAFSGSVRSIHRRESNVLEDDRFPSPGHHYVCGFSQGGMPQFDGRVEYLGDDYGAVVPSRTVQEWLLLGKRNASNARLIKNVRRNDSHRYHAQANEIAFWTITGIGGFGTVIELCEPDDQEGNLCFGVSVKTDGRWTVGPPPALGRDLRSILVASYHEEPQPGSGHQPYVERFLYWGR